MSEHTKRILNQMLALLSGYEQGTASLRYLVDGLEGSLDALEEELPKAFYDQWYVHWGGLEQILAAGTQDKRSVVLLEEDVKALKALIFQLVGEL
jgi:hypothetical protein